MNSQVSFLTVWSHERKWDSSRWSWSAKTVNNPCLDFARLKTAPCLDLSRVLSSPWQNTAIHKMTKMQGKSTHTRHKLQKPTSGGFRFTFWAAVFTSVLQCDGKTTSSNTAGVHTLPTAEEMWNHSRWCHLVSHNLANIQQDCWWSHCKHTTHEAKIPQRPTAFKDMHMITHSWTANAL